MLLTLQTQVFGVRGRNGQLFLEPRLSDAHFDEEGLAQIRCRSTGRDLLVRYHNPRKLDFDRYKIGSIVCGERTLTNPISPEILEDTLTVLDVTLVPKE